MTHSAAKRIWLLTGPKPGDANQLRAIGNAVEARTPCKIEERSVRFHAAELAVTLSFRPSLLGLDTASSDVLRPPWPDVVLTAGRRNEPVARWIQRASGFRTRLVHVGRPWVHPRSWDLVITTPQYFVPEAWSNVVRLALPPVTPPAPLAETGTLALLVGGNSGSQRLTANDTREMISQAREIASARSWRLRATTSARTPQAASDALVRALHNGDDELYLWGDDARENPYQRWLAEASGCIVTTDSISMIAEAHSLARPLWLAPLTTPRGDWWRSPAGWTWPSITHELAQHLAPQRFRRDTRAMLEHLVAAREAAWLADGERAEFREQKSREAPLQIAADAVAGLLEGRR